MPWFVLEGGHRSDRMAQAVARPSYQVLGGGRVGVPCMVCGDLIPTYADELLSEIVRGDVLCGGCLAARRERRIHLVIEADAERVRFVVEGSRFRLVKKDVAVVEQLEDGVDLPLVADVEPDLDILHDGEGGRRDLRSAVSGVDVPDVGVRSAVGNVGDPLACEAVVVEEAADASTADEGVGQAAQSLNADPHLDSVDLDVSVVQDAVLHDDSSSVGGDEVEVGAPASSTGSGASEPTEEVPAAVAPVSSGCAGCCGRCGSGAGAFSSPASDPAREVRRDGDD